MHELHSSDRSPIDHPPQEGVLSLKEQVSTDLKKKLAEFNDPKKGIKVMAMLMGIHEKTLKRLIDCENRPGYQTVFKIYRVLFHTQNDTQLLELVPNPIKEFLIKAHPRGMNDTVRYNINVESEIQKDPVFCEIYCLAGAGGVTREYVSFHYGKYGEKVIEKMLEQEILAAVKKNEYVLGTNQASMTVETLSRVGSHLVQRYYKPENADELGENYLSLQIQGLSEEAFNKWLEIDKEAFLKKCEIAEDNKNWGDIKAFTFNATDTLRESKKELKH
ncbi:MAG: hypothetical protein NXH75_00135 [Halobacteriovoraceae bacterium]|nr:hypothetical protein [Halobacteriovoraceae bacterium]